MRGKETKSLVIDWTLLLSVGLLVLIGLAYLYSAIIAKTGTQDVVASLQGQSPALLNREFAYQLFIGIGVGSVLGYIFFRIDYHKLFQYASIATWIVVVMLAIIALPVLTVTIYARLTGANVTQALIDLSNATNGFLYYANNSIRWIRPGFLIQPAELAKIVLLIYLAAIIDKYKEVNLVRYTRPVLVIGLVVGMIFFQPDLGSIIVIAVVLLAGLWVAGVKVRYFAGLITLVAILGTLFAITASYRNVRVVTWVYQNFCRDVSLVAPQPVEERSSICAFFDFSPQTVDAYQTEQIRLAMARGGLTGVGYNNGDLKTIIPEARTDGIVGVIGEESGFIMVAFILLLYSIIFLRGLTIASRAPDTAGKVLATGIVVWISFQAIWNVMGMTGLIPMKGLTLPFISEGNSSMIVSLAAIGILMNIASQQTIDNSQKVHYSSKRAFQPKPSFQAGFARTPKPFKKKSAYTKSWKNAL